MKDNKTENKIEEKRNHKNHYVSNKLLYKRMTEYIKETRKAKESGKQPPKVPDDIAKMLLLICENLATKANFQGYSYRDEMISDAILNCIQYIDRFDPEKSSNPFAYFTNIAYNAFIRRISIEKKQTAIKALSVLKAIPYMEEFDILDDDDGTDYQNRYTEGLRNYYDYEIINSMLGKRKKKKKVKNDNISLFKEDEENQEIQEITNGEE